MINHVDAIDILGRLGVTFGTIGFIWWFLFVRNTGKWNSSRQQPPPPKKEPPKGYNPFSNKSTPL